MNLYFFTGSSNFFRPPRPDFEIPEGSAIYIPISDDTILSGPLQEIDPAENYEEAYARVILNTGRTFTAFFQTHNANTFQAIAYHHCYIMRPGLLQGLEATLQPPETYLGSISRVLLIVPRRHFIYRGALLLAHNVPHWFN